MRCVSFQLYYCQESEKDARKPAVRYSPIFKLSTHERTVNSQRRNQVFQAALRAQRRSLLGTAWRSAGTDWPERRGQDNAVRVSRGIDASGRGSDEVREQTSAC